MSRDLQYVTDANGERTALILPLEEYESLLEDLHVIASAYKAKDQPTIPFSEVVEELRAKGQLD
jgi:hypothetical protein